VLDLARLKVDVEDSRRGNGAHNGENGKA